MKKLGGKVAQELIDAASVHHEWIDADQTEAQTLFDSPHEYGYYQLESGAIVQLVEDYEPSTRNWERPKYQAQVHLRPCWAPGYLTQTHEQYLAACERRQEDWAWERGVIETRELLRGVQDLVREAYESFRKGGSISAAKKAIAQALKLLSDPPVSGDFRNGVNAEGCWYEEEDGELVCCKQVAGQSGVYLVTTDATTGEVIRDDRPWQMTK